MRWFADHKKGVDEMLEQITSRLAELDRSLNEMRAYL